MNMKSKFKWKIYIFEHFTITKLSNYRRKYQCNSHRFSFNNSIECFRCSNGNSFGIDTDQKKNRTLQP